MPKSFPQFSRRTDPSSGTVGGTPAKRFATPLQAIVCRSRQQRHPSIPTPSPQERYGPEEPSGCTASPNFSDTSETCPHSGPSSRKNFHHPLHHRIISIITVDDTVQTSEHPLFPDQWTGPKKFRASAQHSHMTSHPSHFSDESHYREKGVLRMTNQHTSHPGRRGFSNRCCPRKLYALETMFTIRPASVSLSPREGSPRSFTASRVNLPAVEQPIHIPVSRIQLVITSTTFFAYVSIWSIYL